MNYGRLKSINKLCRSLKKQGEKPELFFAEGSWGSFPSLLADILNTSTKRAVCIISPHIETSENLCEDMPALTGRSGIYFPAWESEPDLTESADETGSERISIALKLDELKSGGKDKPAIFTPVQALCQPLPSPESLKKSSLNLSVGQSIEFELIIEWLTDSGFESIDRVDIPGQFAHRGGIIDIFCSNTQLKGGGPKTAGIDSPPVRIEFFGDVIESIRPFDLDTQLSGGDVAAVSITPPTPSTSLAKSIQMLELLARDTIIILQEPASVQEVAELFCSRLSGVELFSWRQIAEKLNGFDTVHLSSFGSGAPKSIRLNVESVQEYKTDSKDFFSGHKDTLQSLYKRAGEGTDIEFFCRNEAERKRVSEIFTEQKLVLPKNFALRVGDISAGFILPEMPKIFIAHHEVFGQYSLRRRIRASHQGIPVESPLDLKPLDLVVHLSYGIGRYMGITEMDSGGGKSEFLTLKFADEVTIHVPVKHISLVHKYIGAAGAEPKLSKIGTRKWENQKQNVSDSLKDMAAELLELQAKRQGNSGIRFDPDNDWQLEFEETFPYQETADQITAIHQIKEDMITERPMDRLLCGDVGYGKTELAMRAAFKAVQSGMQVALLVPTTVLCAQHGRTFAQRFADYPVSIGVLNRFTTPLEKRRIINETARGQLDILIGTHRILSKDITFSNLGLIIIDEEQRFGVAHKEKLKMLRANVDILTMTATPIPRTLHMSLIGLRDISSLQTPPLDRRSITTVVERYSDEAVKKALLRELSREGQVYFLHNRVKDIEKYANRICRLVPNASVEIAHGQMPKSKLEKAMTKFVLGKADILVSTTIIESGLDIPNANTIIINNSDRFGLAQLHQLRGRVGRYRNKAYAHLLIPPERPIRPVAARRLKAIEEYSHLGAGFKIALRDLEIRGAGNILGPEQSGHINTVGFELYSRLLSNAVKQLKGEPVITSPMAAVNLGMPDYIPRSYIPSDAQRMEIYRKIAESPETEDLTRLHEQLKDIYGPVPVQVRRIIDTAQIRLLASKWQIKSITLSGNSVVFTFPRNNPRTVSDSGGLFARTSAKVKIIDPYTIHLEFKPAAMEPETLISILRKILSQKR
ncbi:Transcription-repair-coupling factor [Limihaloglobus sulfuriphilus]|uniref:Transcription-repair-coupling factor n=1 Tax=Limihaloglobus sulfuriphilus TaxID=1851148 RepID=A0A1Q2MIC3_9BACT|nr:transcription-repair coupling factor [Limihaloglobus sulfuriphilus]AQQ72409.1 Transcription-repair-coupling factor [Limihaloglobus sulfuriphilus]